MSDETQIDGEGVLACREAQEWFDGVKTHCVWIGKEYTLGGGIFP